MPAGSGLRQGRVWGGRGEQGGCYGEEHSAHTDGWGGRGGVGAASATAARGDAEGGGGDAEGPPLCWAGEATKLPPAGRSPAQCGSPILGGEGRCEHPGGLTGHPTQPRGAGRERGAPASPGSLGEGGIWGEFISSLPVQGRQGGGSGGSRPPEPGWGCCMWPCVGIGGDGTLSTTTNWGALLLCPPHQEPLRVSWGVVGEGWVLSLHLGVLRGPDTPTSGWAQHCRLLVRMG